MSRSTFGKILDLLKSLKEKTFFDILRRSELKFPKNFSKKEIISILIIIKDIRNRISHNEVLYDLEINDNLKIKKILNFLKIDDKYKKLNIFHIVFVIQKILSLNDDIIKFINSEFDEIKAIDEEIKIEIFKKMGFISIKKP